MMKCFLLTAIMLYSTSYANVLWYTGFTPSVQAQASSEGGGFNSLANPASFSSANKIYGSMISGEWGAVLGFSVSIDQISSVFANAEYLQNTVHAAAGYNRKIYEDLFFGAGVIISALSNDYIGGGDTTAAAKIAKLDEDKKQTNKQTKKANALCSL